MKSFTLYIRKTESVNNRKDLSKKGAFLKNAKKQINIGKAGIDSRRGI